MTLLHAGIVYAGLAFAAGFVLGVVRALVLAPAFGPVAAVLLETPVILGISWLASSWTMRRFAIAAGAGPRLATGAVAFAVLQVLELALALGLGRSPPQILAAYGAPAGQIGLVAQAVFALIPFAQSPRRMP